MSLQSGTRLGAYEITSKLGEGGMGEVYRARDLTLNRDVAIKVLPDVLAADAERLARFTREAHALAALNHPNIATIHGIEGSALVMELVEGDDLSSAIANGPMPPADALPIARQIVLALEAAHEAGIIHRDLKPANIKVRPDGMVKVLDFGLAKALTPDAGVGTSNAANSPTLTAHATQMGMILGTAAYMSPEQARGKAVDRRADIWAFGVVLYEMLTGRRAFEGEEVSDVLASVLRQEVDWTALPEATPPSVRRLLRRCLEKDPRKRLSAIGDARLDLDENEPAAPTPPPGPAPARPTMLGRLRPFAAGVLVTAAIAALVWPSTGTTPGGLARLAILPPPGASLFPDSAAVSISPDGTMVAFIVGNVLRTDTELWIRSLDSMAARRLEGGDGVTLTFWSPDSRRIGFFTTTQLKTIAATGGRAEVLADAPGSRGGTWSPSGVIVYAPDASGPLYRIPAAGGTPEPVTTLDAERKEYGHRFPTFLPGGDHFLYAALPGRNGKFDIFAGSLSDSSRTFVGSLDASPVYADPGWLLYARQGVLAAQPFDARSLAITGDPVPLGDEPTSILEPAISYTAGWSVAASRNGALAYFSSPSVNTIATWFELNGQPSGTLDVPPGHYESAVISPDGRQAILVRSTSPSESDLWLVDLEHGGASPLSSGRGRNDSPVWSPDGTRVVFSADRDGPQDVFVKTVGDVAPEQPLFRSDTPFKNPAAWSPDGRWIVMTQLDPETTQNVWLLSADADGELQPLVRGPTRDNGGPISPDGRWLAYASDHTGRFELYIQPFPTPGRAIQVSRQGASFMWWTSDGRQLVFLDADLQGLWRVDIEPGEILRVGTPVRLASLPAGILSIAVTPDRQRFLAISPERTGIGSVTVVQNWRAALAQR